MRVLMLTAAVILNLFIAGAAMADIAPDPEPIPTESSSHSLAIAGTALALGVVSLGLWMKKRSSRVQSRT